MSEKVSHFALRTKLLLSLVSVTAGLTCATLLVVRSNYKSQMQKEVETEARNAVLTFRVVEHQHQMELSRKADLVAMLATMRNGDPTTVQEVSENPWQSEDCNLFMLADHKNKIVALYPKVPDFPGGKAEELLRESLKEGITAGWWYSGKALYQVVLQPFYSDAPMNAKLQGVVIVGREFDVRKAHELARLTSSELVLRHDGKVIVSTLTPFQEHELANQLGLQPVAKQIDTTKEHFLADSTALGSGQQTAINLTILKSYGEAIASLSQLNHLLLGLGLIAVLAGGALAFLISDNFTRPLGNLVAGLGALERGSFTFPLLTHGDDEVARATRAFERLRGTLQENENKRQQLEDQLRQSQKMEALGRLAGGVAHDFNNLLTVIKGHSDILQDRLTPDHPLQTSSSQIEKAADRAAALTRQLLAFCRMQVLEPKVIDLNALVSEMCRLLRRLVREDIAFTFQAGESLGRVKADPGQIEQVIVNLTVNACDAMPGSGKLTIETRNVVVDEKLARERHPVAPGAYVLLAVTDTGEGMDANTKARIFEPFFTTKVLGKGTGLGLATVYGVVKQSGGCIWVDSAPGKGAKFEIYLPRVEGQAAEDHPQEIGVTPSLQRETVLLAEDEEGVRGLAYEFLRSAGFKVLFAKDGQEALEIAERAVEPIHVLVTDVVMPRMHGTELARRLRKISPDLKIVYMSGYLEFNGASGNFLEDGFFLQKPFSRDTLVQKVSQALRNEPALAGASVS